MAAQNVDILEVDDGIAAALLQVLILTSAAAKATQAQLRGSSRGSASCSPHPIRVFVFNNLQGGLSVNPGLASFE